MDITQTLPKLVKDDHLDQATNIFGNSGVNITSSGQKHLGAALGSTEFIKKFVKKKVAEWCEEIVCLSTIAKREPQAAYSAFVHGVSHRWNYVLRTIPNTSELLIPVEETIRHQLIPAITGRKTVSDIERDVFALPCRLGGLGITNPVKSSKLQYECSDIITAPIVNLIMTDGECPEEVWGKITQAKQDVRKKRKNKLEDDAAKIQSVLNTPLKRSVDLAKEKGASSWLTALPLEEQGFALYKSAFRDALALRYNWLPDRMPAKCACNASFTVEHALSCPKGAFAIHRHDEIRDITHSLLSEVCHDVTLEPVLQPLDGHTLRHASAITDDCARSDIQAKGFWGTPHQRAFFDVKVFNPHAPSNKKFSIPSCYAHHEQIKRRLYEQRINEVELASFTPLIFSTTGGMGKSATVFYGRLADKIATKRKQPYASTMTWIRCILNFSLIRSSVTCLRGSRHSNYYRLPDSTTLAVYEARI